VREAVALGDGAEEVAHQRRRPAVFHRRGPAGTDLETI
jgi:hypothetical protein